MQKASDFYHTKKVYNYAEMIAFERKKIKFLLPKAILLI
jgi:hypothetical protein